MNNRKCKIEPPEFFDIAVEQGFYGIEKGGLTGKYDNVRRYWEDVITKLTIRDSVEEILKKKSNLRIVDLGCGSGEGFELLTHIPVSNPLSNKLHFTMLPDQISSYVGIDLCESMVEQGRKNYQDRYNVRFEQVDLNKGLQLLDERPFDIYFSSYSSLSHLDPEKLQQLIEEIFGHAEKGSIVVFDLLGKYSLEWPKYWNDNKKMLPYNMAYLIPVELRDKQPIRWYDVCYWEPSGFYRLLDRVCEKTGTKIQTVQCIDRSVFIGRHMETGLFGAPKSNYRYSVNHLFDHDHRAEVSELFVNIDWSQDIGKTHPDVWARLLDYKDKWNCVITLVDALVHSDNKKISYLIETTPADISNELKFLTWLYRNAHRFPVVDFWANVMGPQIAMILRNIEMYAQPAVGCGHGLLAVIKIIDV